MKNRFILIMLLLAGFLCRTGLAHPPEGRDSSTGSVRLHATVLDPNGEPWEGLRQDEFQVTRNGRPVPGFTLRHNPDIPFRAVVLYDHRGPMIKWLGWTTDVVRGLFSQSTWDDRVSIETYGYGQVELTAPSGDLAVVMETMKGLLPYMFSDQRAFLQFFPAARRKDGTADFSSAEALRGALRSLQADPAPKKAVIWVSDTADGFAGQARDMVAETGIPVFWLHFRAPFDQPSPPGWDEARAFAAVTGGAELVMQPEAAPTVYGSLTGAMIRYLYLLDIPAHAGKRSGQDLRVSLPVWTAKGYRLNLQSIPPPSK